MTPPIRTANRVEAVVEIAESSLDKDRNEKGPIFASAQIPHYWIVSLIDGVVETYSNPTGSGPDAKYHERSDFRPGTAAPFVIDGMEVGTVAVADLFAGM